MKLTFTREEIAERSLQDFFILAAEKMFIDTTIGKYDCRYICVSKEIQDIWFEEYKKNGLSEMQISMMLLMIGPKVDENLHGYTARTENGFYCLPYPETIVTDDVKHHYKGNVPKEAQSIDIFSDPICVKTGEYFHRLTWSSDCTDNEDTSYMDFEILDESYNEVDSGLYEIPDQYDNLIDAFDYMVHTDSDYEPYINDRDNWKLIDEETVSSISYDKWKKRVEEQVVYTHNVAAEIVDIFDDFLRKHDMMVPSEDKEEEKDRNFPENDAALYGSEYDDILNEVEEYIIEFLK